MAKGSSKGSKRTKKTTTAAPIKGGVLVPKSFITKFNRNLEAMNAFSKVLAKG